MQYFMRLNFELHTILTEYILSNRFIAHKYQPTFQ